MVEEHLDAPVAESIACPEAVLIDCSTLPTALNKQHAVQTKVIG